MLFIIFSSCCFILFPNLERCRAIRSFRSLVLAVACAFHYCSAAIHSFKFTFIFNLFLNKLAHKMNYLPRMRYKMQFTRKFTSFSYTQNVQNVNQIRQCGNIASIKSILTWKIENGSTLQLSFQPWIFRMSDYLMNRIETFDLKCNRIAVRVKITFQNCRIELLYYSERNRRDCNATTIYCIPINLFEMFFLQN